MKTREKTPARLLSDCFRVHTWRVTFIQPKVATLYIILVCLRLGRSEQKQQMNCRWINFYAGCLEERCYRELRCNKFTLNSLYFRETRLMMHEFDLTKIPKISTADTRVIKKVHTCSLIVIHRTFANLCHRFRTYRRDSDRDLLKDSVVNRRGSRKFWKITVYALSLRTR